MQSSVKKLLGSAFTLLGAGIIIGCYLWFTCRDFCITAIVENQNYFIENVFTFIKKFVIVIALFILFKVLDSIVTKKFLKSILRRIKSSEKNSSLTKIVSFGLWTAFAITTISVFVGNFTALLASLGLVGFGLTLALQKPILNFVGWLTIIFKNLYVEGDRIKINNVVGDVKEIQVMNTIIEGLLESSDVLSGKTISFPNEFVLATDVQNYTKDSNYIVNELKISITYESNYHKAIKLLKEIISNQIKANKNRYLKKIKKQNVDLNNIINGWLTKEKKDTNEKDEESSILKLKEEKEDLEKDIRVLEEEFVPLIRIEMLDSAIELIAQFKCPYDEIKKNRTAINLSFLDAIKKEKDIEVAYPHLQLINKK
ncbi:MAG: mechanosensitive ion channel [Candidatus Woesearchaeota archaeon]|nr:MAG: mechanosensitive ion channel [Candidatus Woesearchaeota archaeon]